MKEFLKYTLATVTGLVIAGIVLVIIGVGMLVGMAASFSMGHGTRAGLPARKRRAGRTRAGPALTKKPPAGRASQRGPRSLPKTFSTSMHNTLTRRSISSGAGRGQRAA